eukprot:sb/3461620/
METDPLICDRYDRPSFASYSNPLLQIPTYEEKPLDEVLSSLPDSWQVCLVHSEWSCERKTPNFPTLPYHQVDFTQPTLMIIGGETLGVSERVVAALEQSQRSVVNAFIPISKPLDSLSTSTAASILIYEMARQYAPILETEESQQLSAVEIANTHQQLGTGSGYQEVSEIVPDVEMASTEKLEFQSAMSDFKAMFPHMENRVIEEVLRRNKGMVDQTIDDLLAITLVENDPEPSATNTSSSSSQPQQTPPPSYQHFSGAHFPPAQSPYTITPLKYTHHPECFISPPLNRSPLLELYTMASKTQPLCRRLSQYQRGSAIRYPELRVVPPATKKHTHDPETHETFVKALKSVRLKQKTGKSAFVENKRTIIDLMSNGHAPSHLFYTKDFLLEELPEISDKTTVVQLFPGQMNRMTDLLASQGLIGVFDRPKGYPFAKRIPLILWVGKIRHPGNAGGIIRTAAGAACLSVIFSPHSVNIWNPAVLRASAGAHYMIPTYEEKPLDEVLSSLPDSWQVCLVHSEWSCERKTPNFPTLPYHQVDFTQPTLMIIGGETLGVSERVVAALEQSQRSVVNAFIPISKPLDSLSTSSAASILIYEMARQYAPILESEESQQLTAAEIANTHQHLGTGSGYQEVSEIVPDVEMASTEKLEFQSAMSDFKAMFPHMENRVIEEVLRRNKGMVDQTIDDLLAITLVENDPEPSATNTSSSSSQPQQTPPPSYQHFSGAHFPPAQSPYTITPVEMASTEKLEFQSAMSDFKAMFPHMENRVIEEVLRRNKGMVDQTIDDLLAITLVENDPEPSAANTSSSSSQPQQTPPPSYQHFSGAHFPPAQSPYTITPTTVIPQASVQIVTQQPSAVSAVAPAASSGYYPPRNYPTLSEHLPPGDLTLTPRSQQPAYQKYGQVPIKFMGCLFPIPYTQPLPDRFLRLNEPRMNSNNNQLMAQVAEDKDFALLLYNQDFLEQARNDQEFMNTLQQDSAARGGAASSSSGTDLTW